ncbi:PREDICTED: uncharacterized protein LOC105626669 [Atta cephalotes]|uniref:Uncharacterized protein n=2 Tax=Atta TaxID=12956 RepID=A0A158P0P5_ATTCE|nr:PREDICTED: uncharacterized protein LOC105626669 [Atta cephalotes]XP_018054228.1 PREDICTED: uncharacterized protein LOC108691101 [Atta colombica]KYM78270.1 hypothetical protein ALC53_11295 [Atta colombica]
MKTIVILLAVSFVTVLGKVTEEDQAKWVKNEKDCIDESGVDPAVLHKGKEEESDENDEKLACYKSCLLKKFGILKEEKIDWDKFRVEMSKYDTSQEKIDEMYNKCKDIDGEGCQKGKNLMKCLQDVKDD